MNVLILGASGPVSEAETHKGRSANALLRLPFRPADMLPPAPLEPIRGAEFETQPCRAFYTKFGPIRRCSSVGDAGHCAL
jgi:hypothetical protein